MKKVRIASINSNDGLWTVRLMNCNRNNIPIEIWEKIKKQIPLPLINSNLVFNPEGITYQKVMVICDDGRSTLLLRTYEKGEKTDF